MKPYIIDNNFFSQDELQDIKTKVLILKPFWKSIKEQHNNTQILSAVLPAAAYSFHYSEKNVSSNNEIMLGYFSNYYDRIKHSLSEYYSVSLDYHPKLQLPGFHIFLNTGINCVSHKKVNFHVDSFPKIKFFQEKIRSAIVPIELPINGSSLIYTNIPRPLPIIDKIDTDQEFFYNLGSLVEWPGKLLHSIAPFSLLNSNDMRITMQMHINFQKNNRGIIFW